MSSNVVRSGWLAAALVVGCASSGSDSSNNSSPGGGCGPGTHRDSAGVCQLDQAFVITSVTGANSYWDGHITNSTSNSEIRFQFSETAGSGEGMNLAVAAYPPRPLMCRTSL